MSNYHVLSGSDKGDVYTIVFHIPVPAAQNKLGTSTIQAALAEDVFVNYGDPAIPKKSFVPWVTAAEQLLLDSGELYEVQEPHRTHPDKPDIQDRDALDARYAVLVAEIATILTRRYAYWRFNRNVP